MRGSVPSFGAFLNLSQQSGSRIPHLKLHIHSRRTQSKSNRLTERTLSVRQQRCVHAAVPALSLSELFFRTTEALEKPQAPHHPSSSPNSSTKYQDFAFDHNLDEILQEAHPERVLQVLLSTSDGKSFVAQADSESFTAALCSIEPWYLIEPYKDVYRYIKPSLATQPQYRWVRTSQERFEMFAEHINEIVEQRRTAGHKLSKDDCIHLLHCARVLGNGSMARHTWQNLIPQDGVQGVLDVRAYNCYMEAICWSNAFSASEQWRLRVSPRLLAIRSSRNPPPDLSGHRTGPLGLRHEALVNFRRLVGQQLHGDEETFTNLMIAMGREGDLPGAKSILKSVYNIDVDLLLEFDEEEVETPTFYEHGSPLRPTSRLLSTIAHVFGSNNDIGVAFKLVDFVSRQYVISIPFNVWMHLLDWAYVLSLRRYGVKKRQGQGIGQVSHLVLDSIWTQMTHEPHNIKPDVAMHICRARSWRDRGNPYKSFESISSAKTLFESARGGAERLRKELISLTDKLLAHPSARGQKVLPAEWFELRHQFILASLIEDRDLQLLIVTIRLALLGKCGKNTEWERRRLPSLMAEYAEYLPDRLTYKTTGGLVEIVGLKWDRIRVAMRAITMSRWNGLLRANVDANIATVDDLHAARQAWRAVGVGRMDDGSVDQIRYVYR